MSKILMISSDCHAGGLPNQYTPYLPKAYQKDAENWWRQYVQEMLSRVGTFFDQEVMDQFAESADTKGEQAQVEAGALAANEKQDILDILHDDDNPFSPRRGEYDHAVRIEELDGDGVAGEIIFPQMAPFGADLLEYGTTQTRDQVAAGCRAYNRWLAELCNHDLDRHAGVALITIDDIDATVKDVRAAHEMGLWGGILLPGTTGEYPYYHHPRYEPLWAVCEALQMPIQTHSGWTPDYGSVETATALFISEVSMWAQRPFPALLWAGAFEKYPGLKLVFTECGAVWVLEALRNLERTYADPMFAHFKRDLPLTPTEYFRRNCRIGASFMGPDEGARRHDIGIETLMWGTDYPHLEGSWPNTMDKMRETFAGYPEAEIRALLGGNAAETYGFDIDKLTPLAERIGPSVEQILG